MTTDIKTWKISNKNKTRKDKMTIFYPKYPKISAYIEGLIGH